MGKPDVDKELIRELAGLLDETGLTEIEIEADDRRIRISRQAAAAPAVMVPPAAGAAPAAATPAAATPAGEIDLAGHPGAVTSPMVGTAYRAAEPDSPPFVNVGDRVSAGQTLMIIEAMKTFNEIPAPCDGTVRQILFENATPVEFGDVLMVVE